MGNNKNIRNIGIVAHVDAGKTTITEQLLYTAGAIRSLGSVDKGTAQTDYLDIEKERGISVKAATVSFDWEDVRINLIDTPGHVDFFSEVERSLRVLDGAIIVLSSAEGVQAQTEVLWQAISELSIPTIIFINKIDRVGSDITRVLKELHKNLTKQAVPMQVVIGEGTNHPVIIDPMTQRDKTWDDEESIHSRLKYLEGKLKTNAGNKIEAMLDNLIEAASADNDDIMMQYLNGEDISVNHLTSSLRKQVEGCRLFPVLYGSAIEGIGISELLSAVVRFLPSPTGKDEGDLSGIIFRLEHDRLMGRAAYVRLYNGVIHNRDSVYNTTKDVEEKVTQIRKINILKHTDVGVLGAGDIAAVYGLNNASIGDVIGSHEFIPKEQKLVEPHLKVQVTPKLDKDYVKLIEALQELSDEDPLLSLEWLKAEREININIMGTIQLEVLTGILKKRFNLDVIFSKPSVIYKETPVKKGEGFEAYTMPKPCWAVIKLLIEPGLRGSGLSFDTIVRAEKILPRYQNHIKKCLPDALKQGLYGWEVTDLKVTLIDGESHNMHTHPLDFFVATPMAVMNGLVNTGTILLEPVLKFHISAPEDTGGRLMNEMIQMRGEFDSPIISKGNIIISGKVPVSTTMDFPIRFSSLTRGKGIFSVRFAGYEPCPIELGATAPRRGINPLDRAKWILFARNALSE